MLFRKTDDAKRLVEIQQADEKRLNTLEKKLENLKPRWMELQEEVERLTALDSAYTGTFRAGHVNRPSDQTPGGTYEPFWTERSTILDQQIATACVQRDALTAELVPEIAACKARVVRRQTLICGAFGSWISLVAGSEIPGRTALQCSAELQSELESARVAAETMPLQDLFPFILKWSERIEQDDTLSCKLLKIDPIIEKALEVA